ncbi:hypothetical protein GWK47_025499 [Chionoecetes opilio]|uniref:Uncharacterized protein n=1 Tax=Chionoecetes opilio TaxID=41210 RepID=A0A8J8WN45_CHIOP|nr:hypothetical protein GWK47_025499 [Chionoecetes opilio]
MALAIHRLYGEPRTAEGLAGPSPPGTGRRDGEVFHSPPWGGVFRIRASFRKAKRRPSLAGSVLGAKKIYEVLPVSTVLSGGIHEGPSIRTFENSNVRQGRAEAGFKHPLGSPRGMMAAGQPQNKLRPFLLNPKASTFHLPCLKPLVSKQKARFVPDAPFVHLLKTTQPRFCQSNPTCRGPKKESAHLPLWEGGCGPRIAQKGREGFSVPKQDQPLRYPWFPVSTSSRRVALSPQFGSRTVLFETAILPLTNSPKTLAVARSLVLSRTHKFSHPKLK